MPDDDEKEEHKGNFWNWLTKPAGGVVSAINNVVVKPVMWTAEHVDPLTIALKGGSKVVDKVAHGEGPHLFEKADKAAHDTLEVHSVLDAVTLPLMVVPGLGEIKGATVAARAGAKAAEKATVRAVNAGIKNAPTIAALSLPVAAEALKEDTVSAPGPVQRKDPSLNPDLEHDKVQPDEWEDLGEPDPLLDGQDAGKYDLSDVSVGNPFAIIAFVAVGALALFLRAS